MGRTNSYPGTRASHGNDLRGLIRPELVSPAEESGETAVLEIPTGGEVLILDEVAAPGYWGVRAEVLGGAAVRARAERVSWTLGAPMLCEESGAEEGG